MKLLICTTMLSLALLFPLLSHAYYNINLQNGQVLEAEDCKVEGNKINVRFKVGSASFPLSLVNSVTDQEGRVSTFSSTGEPQAAAPAVPAPAQPQPHQFKAPQAPGPPSAAVDPLTARGGTSPGVNGSGQTEVEQDTEETFEEVPESDDESSISEGATELTPQK
jgi:hypothetical protein